MEIFKNYKLYQEHYPKYKSWKREKDKQEYKKLLYLKEHPVDEKQKQEDVKRAKILFNAIDVMDEYSQTRAENTEEVTNMVVAQISRIGFYIGGFLGGIILLIPAVKNKLSNLPNSNKFFKNVEKVFPIITLPAIVGAFLGGILTTMGLQGWAASKQVAASRLGRYEAMRKDLSDPKNFVVLNEEQENHQNELIKKMKTTSKMKKGREIKNSSLLNPFTTFSILGNLLGGQAQEEEDREEFEEELNQVPEEPVELSEKDINKAKRDKQLINSIIEKVDIASQDYAENIELATVTIGAVGAATGGLFSYLSNKFMNKFQLKGKPGMKLLPGALGVLITIASTIYAVHLQKEGSRIGRFVAKREMEKDLDNFVYVDEDKLKEMSDDIEAPEKKEKGFIDFMKHVFKDYRDYKKHIKKMNVINNKRQEALKKIEFSEEQIKEAQTLQKNTFKAFNNLDDKSQTYAESVEAVGEILTTPIATIMSSLGVGAGMLLCYKKKIMPDNPKSLPILLLSTTISLIPAILMNIVFTKKQKDASRVADMLAINEMNDYNKFIDYNNLESANKNQNQ